MSGRVDWPALDYAVFAGLAADDRLSKHERIGCPDSYRAGFEAAIFAVRRAPRSVRTGGPRCSHRNCLHPPESAARPPYSAAKTAGCALARYISRLAECGARRALFIFENNLVQFVTIGDNVVLWSGNHTGHHSKIGDNLFVSSQVAVSGFCEIGANSFLGVYAAVGNNNSIARDCWIRPGAVISQNAKEGEIRRSPRSEVAKVSAPRFFRVKE